MKRLIMMPTMFLFILTLINTQSFGQEASAVEILKKVDAVVNAPRDIHQFARIILIDKKGNEKVRESEMYQKGDEMRLVRFLSPADQKGIGFLSLPNDVMYLYLPAFRKIRMIASHVKNTNFAGTDFSYDDMSSFKYSEEYDPRLLETKDSVYVLELTPKPGVEKDYSKLVVWVRKDNFYPIKIDHYDKSGNLWKVMVREKLVKKGNYWIALEMELKDLKKQHSTKLITDKIDLDVGLTDKIFTKRNLKRIK
ncbi:MAG: outer membrane lipoprotein-sorting protein [FCB group bacterium]|nr:outer membrane lipoprotein-sorting protein [FCB group bacterium]